MSYLTISYDFRIISATQLFIIVNKRIGIPIIVRICCWLNLDLLNENIVLHKDEQLSFCSCSFIKSFSRIPGVESKHGFDSGLSEIFQIKVLFSGFSILFVARSSHVVVYCYVHVDSL